MTKLKKYENIDAKLGITYDVLYKVMTEGVWIKYFFTPAPCSGGKTSVHFMKVKSEIYDGKWFAPYITCTDHLTYYLKDYGKTWALTKKELNKEFDFDEDKVPLCACYWTSVGFRYED